MSHTDFVNGNAYEGMEEMSRGLIDNPLVNSSFPSRIDVNIADYGNYSFYKLYDAFQENIEETVGFFMECDSSFDEFLGIPERKTIQGATKTAMELLLKEHNGTSCHYLIYDDDYNKVVGILYFYDYKPKWSRCAIGIGFIPEYRGNALAERVIKHVTKILVKVGLTRVEVKVETNNTASLRVCSKLEDYGYIFEGTEHNAYGAGSHVRVYAYTGLEDDSFDDMMKSYTFDAPTRRKRVLKKWLSEIGCREQIGYDINTSEKRIKLYSTRVGMLIGKEGVNIESLKKLVTEEFGDYGDSRWEVKLEEIGGGFLRIGE